MLKRHTKLKNILAYKHKNRNYSKLDQIMVLIKCKTFFIFTLLFEKCVKYFIFQNHLVISIIFALLWESYKINGFAIFF